MKVMVSAQALVPWSGGSAISEASLCSSLARYAQVTIICRQGAIDYAFARSFGIKEVIEYQQKDAFRAWKDAKHWMRKLIDGMDIVHLNGHWRWEDYFFARICMKDNVPYVLQPRGMLLLSNRKPLIKRVYNWTIGNWVVEHASRVIALSKFETKQFCHYPVAKEKIRIIPNGVSYPATHMTTRPIATDKPSYNSINQPYFLYLGRIEARKNLVFLIEVFNLYRQNGGKAVLWLVGPVEREYDKLLQKKIDKLHLHDAIRIDRPVYDDDKFSLMKESCGVIYPSLDEPFGRVPFEAVAVGTCPIIPDESGSAEYLRAFIPECVYKHQDAESLLAVLQRFEQKSKAIDNSALMNANKWVTQTLDWHCIAERFMALYDEVINKSTSVSLPTVDKTTSHARQ